MEFTKTVALFVLSLILLIHKNVAEKRSIYIVHMDKPAMPKAFSTHHYWYSSILKSAQSLAPKSLHDYNKPDPKLIYTYDHAFHGFSALMSKDELQALKKSPGFISAYADNGVTLDTTRTTEFLSLNTATGLWPASQYGKDVIIGIIDTGIWPESPSFRDDGMTAVPARWKGSCKGGAGFNSSLCNKKIIGARYFNQGVRATNTEVEITLDSARDVSGHGTHVASIAAGNFVEGVSFFGYAPGTARGVAPRARLAVYNIFAGESTEADTLAGIDQAVADGVDILSCSLSFGSDLYENPLSIAGFGAREKGILVSVSAGNRGPSFGSIRNSIPWAVIVASGTVDRWFAGTLTLGNGKTITGWTLFPARATISNLQLYYNATASGCHEADVAEVPDSSIIVCNITSVYGFEYDSVMRDLPNSNARAAVIIIDDPIIFQSRVFRFPGVVISQAEGTDVINYARNSATPTASIGFQETILGTEPRAAPSLSDFSSRGPGRGYDGILKPDVMAPGSLILAAYNPHTSTARIGNNIFLSTDYTLLSGTSMSCPHISGVAALLKAAHPDWSPAAIQSAMMTTASILDNTNKPIMDQAFNQIASPLGIGSGMIDPNRALNPGLVYDASLQDLVNLVCSMNFTTEQTRTIIRSTYNCSNPSYDLNYPSFVALIRRADIGKMVTRRFKRIVTNVGNGAATYKVKVEAPVNSTIRVKPKTLVFRKKYEKKSYTLSIRYKGDIETQNKPGSLTWVEQSGKNTVRSPIMISAANEFFGD